MYLRLARYLALAEHYARRLRSMPVMRALYSEYGSYLRQHSDEWINLYRAELGDYVLSTQEHKIINLLYHALLCVRYTALRDWSI